MIWNVPDFCDVVLWSEPVILLSYITFSAMSVRRALFHFWLRVWGTGLSCCLTCQFKSLHCHLLCSCTVHLVIVMILNVVCPGESLWCRTPSHDKPEKVLERTLYWSDVKCLCSHIKVHWAHAESGCLSNVFTVLMLVYHKQSFLMSFSTVTFLSQLHLYTLFCPGVVFEVFPTPPSKVWRRRVNLPCTILRQLWSNPNKKGSTWLDIDSIQFPVWNF